MVAAVVGRVQEAVRGMNIVVGFDCGTRLIVRIIRYTKEQERESEKLINVIQKLTISVLSWEIVEIPKRSFGKVRTNKILSHLD